MKQIFKINTETSMDCTNGGISSGKTEMVMFFDCTEDEALELCEQEEIDPTEVLFLQERKLFGGKLYPYARPLKNKKSNYGKCGEMYGGNDLDVRGMGFKGDDERKGKDGVLELISIHDRYETQERYNELSR